MNPKPKSIIKPNTSALFETDGWCLFILRRNNETTPIDFPTQAHPNPDKGIS